MAFLRYWLLLVAFFRLSSVYFGYFNKWALQVAVYSQTQLTDTHARTFAVWTSMTCLLCIMSALHLENAPLYITTFLSFVAALSHFAGEFFYFKTMSLRNFLTIGTIATVSIVWMAVEWDQYVPSGLPLSW